MSTEEIRIRVPRRVAQAFRSADPEKRRKMELYVAQRLGMYEKGASSSFDDVWKCLGEEAEENGLTEEKLAAMLEEIDADRPRGPDRAESREDKA